MATTARTGTANASKRRRILPLNKDSAASGGMAQQQAAATARTTPAATTTNQPATAPIPPPTMRGGKYFADVLYGSIYMDPLCLQFIDTPIYQRLARLQQLGIVSRVYKSAVHTRFDHCIGVAHLSERWAQHLQRQHPELNIPNRHVQLVKLAGLLHDVGHSFFSHLCDMYIAEIAGIECADHEERGCQLVRHLVKVEHIPLAPEEVDVICAMICGKRLQGWPAYLFQIVANEDHGIDSDKIDYIRRDSYFTSLPAGFQADRAIANSRIIDGELCFNAKVYNNLFQLFHNRFYFHREIYRHHTVVQLETMIVDMIKAALPALRLKERFRDPDDWAINLDDQSILFLIRSNPSLVEANQLLNRIERRKLYRAVTVQEAESYYNQVREQKSDTEDAKNSPASGQEVGSKRKRTVPKSPPRARAQARLTQATATSRNEIRNLVTPVRGGARGGAAEKGADAAAAVPNGRANKKNPLGTPVHDKDMVLVSAVMGYTNKPTNPLDRVWFFHSKVPHIKVRLNDKDISMCLPLNFSEVRTFHLMRDDNTLQK